MREIEIKVRLHDKTDVLKRLSDHGVKLSEPMTQRDQVFGPEGVNGGDENTAPWLRIRSETKGSETRQIFTLKKSVTNQLDSIEHETEVTDEAELTQIIRKLGFVPYMDITKTRQKAKRGDVEICVDTVDGLGDFIEAEKLTDEDADYEAVVAELWQLFAELGLSRDDQVTDGYDVLLRKLQGLS